MGCFIGFPSAKKGDTGDKQTAVFIAEAQVDWFVDFEINNVRRKEGYKEIKQKFQDQMLKTMLSLYPFLEGKIDYIECATPLTNNNYLGHYDSYGLEMSKARMDEYFMKINVEGV